MKRILIPFLLLAMVMAGTAFAGEFGGSAPNTKEGQFSLGLGYSYSDIKLKPENTSVNGFNFNEKKIQQNQFFLEGGYGFLKGWEVYLRLGAADLQIKDGMPDGTDFSDGYKFFGSLGFRGLLYSEPTWNVGAFLQGTYFSEYSDVDPQRSELKISSPWEIDIGVSAQINAGPAVIYVGPVLYWIQADVKDTDLDLPSDNAETKYKQKNFIGGFAGVKIPFGGSYYADLEYQYKDGSVFGVVLGTKF